MFSEVFLTIPSDIFPSRILKYVLYVRLSRQIRSTCPVKLKNLSHLRRAIRVTS